MNPILRGFLFVLGLLLVMVGLLAGGCSAITSPDLFSSGDYYQLFLSIWLMGLAICVVSLALGIFILRRLRRPALPKADTFDPDAP
jgi:hypothetical protein